MRVAQESKSGCGQATSAPRAEAHGLPACGKRQALRCFICVGKRGRDCPIGAMEAIQRVSVASRSHTAASAVRRVAVARTVLIRRVPSDRSLAGPRLASPAAPAAALGRNRRSVVRCSVSVRGSVLAAGDGSVPESTGTGIAVVPQTEAPVVQPSVTAPVTLESLIERQNAAAGARASASERVAAMESEVCAFCLARSLAAVLPS